MKPISAEQRKWLDKPRHEPYEAFRLISQLIEQGESLDPRWRTHWKEAREFAIEIAIYPETAIARIDAAVDAIQDLDSEIADITLGNEDRVCLLLGAGASAPAPSAIPTVTQLLPELWRRARKIGRDDIDRLANWCDAHKIVNIEDLLTAAYLANFAAKNASVTGLLDYFMFRAGDASEEDPRMNPAARRGRSTIPRVDAASIALLQDTLQVLFALLTGTMIPAPPNPGHDAIVEFVKKHRKTSIITTNYDGCVDEALIRDNVSINSYVDESQARLPDGTDLIKIHGSINWSYCESCHEVRNFNLIDLKKSYADDTASYAVIGICKSCGGQRRPLLIPPLGFKFIIFPNLILLWNTARERIEQARYIVVIGYSFSEADTYINKIIERSMTQHDEQRIIVCDPNVNLVRILRDRFAARIDGFDTRRILAATGSSDKIVPQVLEKLINSTGKAGIGGSEPDDTPADPATSETRGKFV
jgi:NAD-dependent SIR2 family protein deacetylase